jgi:hypothetical protein
MLCPRRIHNLVRAQRRRSAAHNCVPALGCGVCVCVCVCVLCVLCVLCVYLCIYVSIATGQGWSSTDNAGGVCAHAHVGFDRAAVQRRGQVAGMEEGAAFVMRARNCYNCVQSSPKPVNLKLKLRQNPSPPS